MKLNDRIKWFAVIFAVCILGIFYIIHDDSYNDTYIKELSTEETFTEKNTSSSVFLYVEVCGYVNLPGVYKVPEGTRVYQVIEMAGGLKEEAGTQSVNQAAPVTDGQQIYIPDKDEEIVPSKDTREGLVDINQAELEELMTLPGIGQSKAEAIISYRESAGRFASIEDIMKVSGIKEAAFNKIRELICV